MKARNIFSLISLFGFGLSLAFTFAGWIVAARVFFVLFVVGFTLAILINGEVGDKKDDNDQTI